MTRLTEKQMRFVAEYLVDLNATQAAKRAGYKDPNIGRQLIAKNNVSAAIQEAKAKRSKRTEITQDMVVRELAAIGFSKATDYAAVDGPLVNITPTVNLSEQQAAAIASIEQGNFGIKLKLHDKVRALELLGKHLGMFDKGGAQQVEQENNLLSAIMEVGEVGTDDLPEVE